MEIVTVFLSSLLLLISPVGMVLDHVAENAIRDRLARAESLDVRIDNGPSYQLLQGKVDKVRVVGRGISPILGLRIDVAELESDPIDLDFNRLRQGEVILDQALQGAAHIVLTEADVNAFLRSPFVAERLNNLNIGALATNPAQARESARYRINSPSVDFLNDGGASQGEDRIRLRAALEDVVEEASFAVEIETGLAISAGDRLMLIDPIVVVDSNPVDPRLINIVLGGLNNRLALQQLDESGVIVRIINFDIKADALDLAFWVRVDPSFTALATNE
ncbi:hypothetical protein S7335_3098 [Synechococcus sp. PCC 7335]|uniref:LmeA family phospholipid-binding protein n=1 Tax=Synechococcus sp. (strain ATCC 29403 / PCC 7335) TaxID=91464 RepID=UPI00017EE481|nr:DUF2993 domain-containing protein [Synechococcus sp. PCC 7335]EDX85397.1 hypothetical protein S7335_3098 [Synechococcus sp. PCC 7335]